MGGFETSVRARCRVDWRAVNGDMFDRIARGTADHLQARGWQPGTLETALATAEAIREAFRERGIVAIDQSDGTVLIQVLSRIQKRRA